MNAVMLAAERNFRENNCREAYKGINFFKKGYVPNTSMCRRDDGSLLAERNEVLNRWRQYFYHLLNPEGMEQNTPPSEAMWKERGRGDEDEDEEKDLAPSPCDRRGGPPLIR